MTYLPNPDTHDTTTTRTPTPRLGRRLTGRRAGMIALVATALAAGISTTAAARGSNDSADVAALKHATAAFRDVAVAENPGGYQEFRDVDGIACIDMPDMGAMGVHYVNGGLVGDGEIELLRPEAVVYEPAEGGHLRLVAVEYVVPKAAWDAHHNAPPTLFGRPFDFTPSPNRFGLPDFYSLHAWVWKHNPSGTFAMWNPRVHCDGDDQSHQHTGHDAYGRRAAA